MNRCCCLKVILCWQWQGSPQWESRCRKSASGRKRPAHWLGVPPETILTPELLAKLLADEQGGRKAVGARHFYAVLNQADTPQRQAAGERTKELLWVRYGVSVVLTTFSERERA